MVNDKSFWMGLPGRSAGLAGVIMALVALYSADSDARDIDPQAGPEATGTAAPGAPSLRLRSAPATLSSGEVDAMLVQHDLYDKWRNAGGRGPAHRYEPRVIGDTVVVLDRGTGLMWQKGGSETLDREQALEYVRRLNLERHGGFDDWRLPTLEEAMSLVEPKAREKLHIAPVFKKGINFIWSADSAGEGRGWVVYFYDGALSPEPAGFNAWVRAVRSAEGAVP
jgi:hypothetical protein